jgi:hypothetical protein
MATAKKSDLDEACGASKQCGADQQDNLDTGKTFGTVSTVGFVVGAVGLVAGGYLFFTSGASKSALAPPKRGVFVGVDNVGLRF